MFSLSGFGWFAGCGFILIKDVCLGFNVAHCLLVCLRLSSGLD